MHVCANLGAEEAGVLCDEFRGASNQHLSGGVEVDGHVADSPGLDDVFDFGTVQRFVFEVSLNDDTRGFPVEEVGKTLVKVLLVEGAECVFADNDVIVVASFEYRQLARDG